MRLKIRHRRHHGVLPRIAGIVERWVVHQVSERLPAFVVVGSKTFRDEAASVDRLDVVFTKPFGPIGAHREQTGHQDTRNEAQCHHRFTTVVDKQTEFVEGPVLEHFRVGGAFHASGEKNGVFESASWDRYRYHNCATLAARSVEAACSWCTGTETVHINTSNV